MRYVKAFILIIVIVLAMLFLVQNYQALSVNIDFMLDLSFIKYHVAGIPMYFYIIGALGVSALVTTLFFMGDKLKTMKQIKALNTRIASLEQELTSLRNLPLEEDNYPAGDNAEEGAQEKKEEE